MLTLMEAPLFKEAVGLFSILIAACIYLPYLRLTLQKKIVPHPFTWGVWVLLTGTAFFAQVADGAGPGAWMNAFVAVICVVIFIATLKYGYKEPSKADRVALIMAIGSVIAWRLMGDPLWAVVMVSLGNTISYVPTVRKSFRAPYSESAAFFAINASRHAVSLFALAHVSLTTALFPAVLIVNNSLFALFLMVRRQKIPREDILKS